MNIICPNCRAKSRIADERVPQNGAWARCPKCQNRFFIRHPQPLPTDEADGLAQPQAAGQNDLRQRILSRVRGKEAQAFTSQSPDAGPEPEILVFPEPVISNAACVAMGLGLLAIPLIFMALFFHSAASWEPAPPTIISEVAPPDETREKQTAVSDLLWLRRQTSQRNYLLYNVDYSGSESKIIKYYQTRLIPGVCPEITGIAVKSGAPPRGFTATATCLDPRMGLLEMRVDWINRSALVSFPAYNVREEVLLFPVEE